jgi:hypothetical protein
VVQLNAEPLPRGGLGRVVQDVTARRLDDGVAPRERCRGAERAQTSQEVLCGATTLTELLPDRLQGSTLENAHVAA